jgi:hypothetical protein
MPPCARAPWARRPALLFRAVYHTIVKGPASPLERFGARVLVTQGLIQIYACLINTCIFSFYHILNHKD